MLNLQAITALERIICNDELSVILGLTIANVLPDSARIQRLAERYLRTGSEEA